MIGFKYICNLYNVQYKFIAKELGIKTQSINMWLKGDRKIPIKRVEEISQLEIFKGIPKEYYQKEFDEIDELKIQKIKFDNGIKTIKYNDVTIDPITGEKISMNLTYHDSNLQYESLRMDYDIKEKRLLTGIKDDLNNSFDGNKSDGGLNDASELLDLYQMFTDIVGDEGVNKVILKKLLLATKSNYQGYSSEDEFVVKTAKEIKELDKKLLEDKTFMDGYEHLFE